MAFRLPVLPCLIPIRQHAVRCIEQARRLLTTAMQKQDQSYGYTFRHPGVHVIALEPVETRCDSFFLIGIRKILMPYDNTGSALARMVAASNLPASGFLETASVASDHGRPDVRQDGPRIPPSWEYLRCDTQNPRPSECTLCTATLITNRAAAHSTCQNCLSSAVKRPPSMADGPRHFDLSAFDTRQTPL